MRRNITWLLLAAMTGAGIHAGIAYAETRSGFSGSTLARGRFGEIDVKNALPANAWRASLKTRGVSDLYVQTNVWEVGGTTGWHTHPGHSLIIVTAGTVTAYDSDDPNCTPHQYSVGMGFVDPGGDHAHVLRNEGTVEARTIAVQLLPADAGRTSDAPDPGTCPF